MAFIRQKTVGSHKYYQVVRNYREGGKHKQEVLCHLGRHPSLDEAIIEVSEEATYHEEQAATYKERAQTAKMDLLDTYGDVLGGEIPSKNEVLPRWRTLCYDRQWEYQLYDSYELDGNEKERWLDGWMVECKMYEAIFTYHTLIDLAAWDGRIASASRMRLTKLLHCQRTYCS
jgi:hypothetical protein